MRSARARPLRRRQPRAADLDKQIADAQAALADADAALQAASPNYGQLVQQVVPAKDVFAALHPDEAFAAIALSEDDGWVFLLRNGTITVSKVDGGVKEIAELVARIRAGIELTTDRLADVRYRRCPEAVPDHAGRRGQRAGRGEGTGRGARRPAAVAAVRSAADRAGRCRASWPTRRGWCASSPWRMCRRRPTSCRCARSPAGSRASHPWFGFGDFRPVTLAQAEKTFSGAGLRRKRQAARRAAAAAVRAQGAGGGARAARRRCRRTNCWARRSPPRRC